MQDIKDSASKQNRTKEDSSPDPRATSRETLVDVVSEEKEESYPNGSTTVASPDGELDKRESTGSKDGNAGGPK